ncbi:hypothetical protein [uncultured Sulfitobacter sp.]|uniref:hypothetical protein n=1 Tax=uncultured Sulfitobacter sp. TaxID=191468 RepID=UPI002625B275|nr:hypothetical protein [uncultured Sulfitobacter sp.]
MATYSDKAQPFLDLIAAYVFNDRAFRDWLVQGTSSEQGYEGSTPLIEEQKRTRWVHKPTKQPFWANYWCGRDRDCTCRIEGSKGLESDAIFFLRNDAGRTLAIHVEFKHPNEAFSFGQPEAYPLRAECFAQTHSARRTLNAHEDWMTVLFCGDEALDDPRLKCFDRVITHVQAANKIVEWPQ